jgi:hypothetical protein
MSELAALQAQFAAALGDAAHAPALAGALVGPPAQSLRRIAIYRGALQANRATALANAFPVVAKIVGDEFFAGLAREYGKRHPSTTGDLNEYGERFAEFLSVFPPAQALTYLADVARLDWAVHRSHYAADAAALDPARLATVSAVDQPHIKLGLHPAVALVQSSYPIARVWEVHQPEYAGEVDVDLTPGQHYALVCRPEYKVRVAALRAGEFTFLAASSRGGVLGEALDAALRAEPSFDFPQALVHWIVACVIVAFTV